MFGLKILKDAEWQNLKEEVSLYKRELEDVGWINFSTDPAQGSSTIFAGAQGFKKMLNNCKVLYYTNPLAGQWIHLTTQFVFGEGLSIPKSKDEGLQNVISEFWDDVDNKKALTSFMSQQLLSNKLQYEGNLFFLLFEDDAGRCKIRILNALEIDDIIMDPNDRLRPNFYKVPVLEKSFNFTSDSYSFTQKGFAYYPDVDCYDPTAHKIPANKLRNDARVYHVKINCDINDKFGVPDLYRGSGWINAHKTMAEDLATLIKALSQYAWKKKVKGTATQVSTLANALTSRTNLTNIKNSAGQMQVENEAVDLQSIDIKTGGVKVGTDGLRQMKLMVCAGSGIFEHYFGDPSTGNLATAKTMELPMVKKFATLQSLWTDVILGILNYVIDRKIEIGELPGTIIDDKKNERRIYKYKNDENEREIDIDFPPILEEDLKVWADALTTAKNGNLITEELAAELFMLAANVNNIDEELEELKVEIEQKKQDDKDKFDREFPPMDASGAPLPAKPKPGAGGIDPKIKPVKEAVELPAKRIEMRSQKKEQFVMQKMNGYRKIVNNHFRELLASVRENSKVSGSNGQFVGHVPGFQEITHKFLEKMRESARVHYPIAISIGEKFIQSVIKDLKPEIKIEETLYEARGRAKTILGERLKWNDYFLYDKLEPDMISSIEKTIKQSYRSEEDFYEAVTGAVKKFESRMELYVGAFWTVEQEAVKEAGRGVGIMVNFAGPEDDHNCEGCESAVNGGPYPIEEAPIPGEQDCLGRCRHALQVVT